MKRIHALLIALLLAAAAVLGLFSVARTTALGASSSVSDSQLAARSRQLDTTERQLKALRTKRPPALPVLRAGAAAAPAARRTIFVPAAPATLASSHGEDDDGGHGDDVEHGDDD